MIANVYDTEVKDILSGIYNLKKKDLQDIAKIGRASCRERV